MSNKTKSNKCCEACGSTKNLKKAYSPDEDNITLWFCPKHYEELVEK